MTTMTEDHKLHLSHYLALMVILNIGVLGFLFFSYNFTYKIIVLLFTSLAYILWGVVHHWMADDLHPRVILEYVVIALLANIMIIALEMRV